MNTSEAVQSVLTSLLRQFDVRGVTLSIIEGLVGDYGTRVLAVRGSGRDAVVGYAPIDSMSLHEPNALLDAVRQAARGALERGGFMPRPTFRIATRGHRRLQ